ncbi:DNA mismatch repair protein MutS [Gallicola sp. Sow4_E12]|uniref:DNA mismatch repair protein MutS n=1 Tax=Gallicola sp. Sow4_E12 TaxID=3438785 RepID=UPI003F93815F
MAYTPMMQQYLDLKEKNPDCILFFRLGDFYEMFFEDAKVASRELEIVMTKRDCGDNQKCPMCGVPHHVADIYISKLVSKGYKVAICEQMEDPKLAKGLLKRDIIRIITPGTVINSESIDHDLNNYLMSLVNIDGIYGISYCDITTGEIQFTEIPSSANQGNDIENEITRIQPVEIIYDEENIDESTIQHLKNQYQITFTKNTLAVSENPLKDLENYFSVDGLRVYQNKITGLSALNYILRFVYKYQEDKLLHLKNPRYYEYKEYLDIDAHSIVNLEILKNLYTKTKKGSLFDVLDKTQTSMGSRLLRSYLERPLMNRETILYRQQYVEAFYNSQELNGNLQEILKDIYDLERIIGKLAYSKANGRDLLSLKNSIFLLPQLKELLIHSETTVLENTGNQIDTLEDLYQLIHASIVEEPPINITEGNLIKDGFNKKLDKIRNNKVEGQKRLIEFEQREKNRLNIKNLKIVFNKKLGYFIDITKSHLSKVPEEYIKKQTLTNSDRFITSELLEIQSMILDSENEISELEYSIFNSIREEVLDKMDRIKQTSQIISFLDVASCLAFISKKNNYTTPQLNNVGIMDIVDSRHPVVEQSIGKENFIANNITIGNGRDNIQIITGPNMSGKSTYLRQIALVVVMAQIGSFVPCETANISIVDKIFTRIGASDNLYSGESTFMVEMNEMSNILRNATTDSLLILDEVGRGTSTFDGLSIAWSILEYISKNIKAKTLFATHYHELTELEHVLKNVVNLKIQIEEYKDDIIFLRKIIKGKSDKSYGIEVAKLAGLPPVIIKRAKELLNKIEEKEFTKNDKNSNNIQTISENQMDFNKVKELRFIEEIVDVDIHNLTPLQAMDKLNSLIEKAKTIGGE